MKGMLFLNIRNIDKILSDFIENKEYKAILIDGPWGCGKTYQVNETIKDIKRKNHIYYISLFGLESVDEINTKLFYKYHKFKRWFGSIFKTTFSVVSKSVPIFKEININAALDFQLGNSKLKLFKKSIVIFDDLERLSKNVSYENLLGYINSLFMTGCRIMCLASSENIDSERKKSYNNFKEKVFDCIYSINCTNENVLNDIFSKYNISNINSLYPLLENNLRIAKKVSLFYEDILKLYKRRNIKVQNGIYNNYEIINAAIITVNIALNNNINDNNSNLSSELVSYFNIFGENIAYGLKKYFKAKYKTDNIFILVQKMLYLFCYDDSYELDNLLFPRKIIEDEYSILNESFFYLSQQNKIKFKNVLEKYILSDKFDIKNYISKIGDVIKYSSLNFSDIVLKKIAQQYVEKYTDYHNILFEFQLEEISGCPKIRADDFLKKLVGFINDFYQVKVNSYCTALSNESNYGNLTKLINEITYAKGKINNAEINLLLIHENFFLPNLSEDIDYDKWDYCHTIARYAKDNNLSVFFKNCCMSIYDNNPYDETLKDRLSSLIIYSKIDENFLFSTNMNDN